MASLGDLYQILGVSKSATADQIRTAYRKLARKYHPDMNPGNKQAEEHFKKINSAYDALSDPKRRKLYDEFGDAALNDGFDPGKARAYQEYQQRARTRRPSAPSFEDEEISFETGSGFDDERLGSLFGNLFGQGGKRRRARPSQGQDVHTTVELDLAQALCGVEIQVQIPGSPQREPITIRIPPGADDGSKLKVKGRGIPGQGGAPAGDLVIETKVRPHPHFKRDGLDLTLKLPVTLDEAYNGASLEVPIPDGKVMLKVPPRSQQGSRLRLKGKGVSRGGQRGDLYVELDVRLPDREDGRLAEAFRESRAAYSQPVRADVKL